MKHPNRYLNPMPKSWLIFAYVMALSVLICGVLSSCSTTSVPVTRNLPEKPQELLKKPHPYLHTERQLDEILEMQKDMEKDLESLLKKSG